MSIYTSKQRQYIDAFMLQVNALFDHGLFSPGQDDAAFLDTLSSVTDSLSAGITLVSLIMAVPTVGASLAIGSACIVLLKTGSSIYKYVRSHTDSQSSLDDLTGVDYAERRLSMLILFRQVVYLLATRYAYVIDEVIADTDEAVKELALFAVARVMKKFTLDLLAQEKKMASASSSGATPLVFSKADVLVDHLLSGEKFLTAYEMKRIALKNKSYSAFASRLYERPRWALYNNLGIIRLLSSNEDRLLRSDSTLSDCGYIAISDAHLESENVLVNTKHWIEVQDSDIKEPGGRVHVVQKQCIEYLVTRADVEAYLADKRAHSSTQSLNDYLSMTHKQRVIAGCHGTELVGLDLSEGDFSEVRFRQAQLQRCSLQNTIWTEAHLEEAQFESNILTGSQFRGVYAEQSTWRNIDFTGDFSLAHMNGTLLSDCNLNLTLQKEGCDWELAVRERVTVNGDQVTHNRYVDEQLTKELQARIALSLRVEQLAQNVEALQQEQEQQHERTQLLDRRVNKIEVSQSVISVVRRHWDTWLNTPVYRNSKKAYVPLSVASESDTGPEKILCSLRLERFIQSNEVVLLMTGPLGAGKSFEVNKLQEKLMQDFKNKEVDYVPVNAKLSEVPFSEENFFWAILNHRFPGIPLEILREYRFLLILDSLDECAFPVQRNLIEECLSFAQSMGLDGLKVLALAQKRFLLELEPDYHQIFRIDAQTTLSKRSECDMLSVSEEQKIAVLGHQDDNILAMAKTPIMLHMIDMVLRSLPAGELKPSSRIQFYDEFCKDWFAHIQHKLPIGEATENWFQAHIQALAFEMFKEQRHWLERPYQRERRNRQKAIADPLSDLFEQKPNRFTLLSMSIQENSAKQLMMRYEFIHPLFESYALAQKLVNDFFMVDARLDLFLAQWNHRLFLECPGAVSFLQEMIQESSEKSLIEGHLLAMVLATRGGSPPRYPISASNAMTLLCRLRFDFSGLNLSGIRIVKADLSRGLLAYTDLSDSDLTEVCFHEATLIHCNMQGAILRNARFHNAHAFIQTEKPSQTFAVYPYMKEPIVAFDLPPTVVGSAYRIAIARLSDGQILQCWPAHGQVIQSMAWTTHQNVTRLASAGAGGTVRIWTFNQDGEMLDKSVTLKSLKHKTPVVNLAWGADGNTLAISSEDNIVRIWDVNQQKRQFKSMVHGGMVRAVLWGHSSSLLISPHVGI